MGLLGLRAEESNDLAQPAISIIGTNVHQRRQSLQQSFELSIIGAMQAANQLRLPSAIWGRQARAFPGQLRACAHHMPRVIREKNQVPGSQFDWWLAFPQVEPTRAAGNQVIGGARMAGRIYLPLAAAGWPRIDMPPQTDACKQRRQQVRGQLLGHQRRLDVRAGGPRTHASIDKLLAIPKPTSPMLTPIIVFSLPSVCIIEQP